MQGDPGRCREIREDAGRSGEMQGDPGRCRKIWEEAGRSGEMQGDPGRCGEMRGDPGLEPPQAPHWAHHSPGSTKVGKIHFLRTPISLIVNDFQVLVKEEANLTFLQ